MLSEGWTLRESLAPLYPGGQWKKTELVIVARWQGETRILELESVRPMSPGGGEKAPANPSPTELFALAWKFQALGFRAIRSRATARLRNLWRRIFSKLRRP